MKILVIQTAFLGDAIISLSLAGELRRIDPSSVIFYLVRPEVAPIIRLSPSVDQIVTFDKYGSESGLEGISRKAEQLNLENFDIIFTLHSSKRSMMLLDKLNAGRKIGYGNSKSLTDKVVEVPEPHTARAVRLLQVIHPDAELDALPVLDALESDLPPEVLRLPRPIVAIAPDSIWKTKQWGYSKYLNVLNRLVDQNCSIILTGTRLDSTLSNAANSLEQNVLSLLGRTTLPELAAVIAYSDLAITNDSATAHIATATRTRSIVVFGPTIPEFGFAPPQQLGRVIENSGLWCRPCASHGGNECPIHTHECMTSISAERVAQAAIETIGV